MVKKIIEHVDFFGEPLLVGDIVVAADGGTKGSMAVCKVIKLNPKLVELETIARKLSYGRNSFLRYPHFMVKVHNDIVIQYILENR
jgi:hypothetical protein